MGAKKKQASKPATDTTTTTTITPDDVVISAAQEELQQLQQSPDTTDSDDADSNYGVLSDSEEGTRSLVSSPLPVIVEVEDEQVVKIEKAISEAVAKVVAGKADAANVSDKGTSEGTSVSTTEATSVSTSVSTSEDKGTSESASEDKGTCVSTSEDKTTSETKTTSEDKTTSVSTSETKTPSEDKGTSETKDTSADKSPSETHILLNQTPFEIFDKDLRSAGVITDSKPVIDYNNFIKVILIAMNKNVDLNVIEIAVHKYAENDHVKRVCGEMISTGIVAHMMEAITAFNTNQKTEKQEKEKKPDIKKRIVVPGGITVPKEDAASPETPVQRKPFFTRLCKLCWCGRKKKDAEMLVHEE